MATLHVTIDSTEFATTDDDQEAAGLLRLAGCDPARYDLFLIDDHGIETRIDDDQIVNLRDGEQFATRWKVRFTVDGTRFSTYDDDQTAAALLRRAGLNPADHDLIRVGPGEHRELYTDDQLVAIADGDEFVTAERQREVTIIINTRPHQWHSQRITYAQVVELAYPGQPVNDQEDVTVRYTHRHGHGGTVTAGHDVQVKEGMVFDVYRTTRS
jgi:hypothetical protein